MNIAVAVDEVMNGEAVTCERGGSRPKRIVVAYGFWIFLLSDIVMFSALFASYAVLVHATAGGPTGAQLFNQVNVAIETACLLLSSYSCGLMSLAINSRRDLGTYFCAPWLRSCWAQHFSLSSFANSAHDCDGRDPAAQRVSFRLFYAGRLSRAARDAPD